MNNLIPRRHEADLFTADLAAAGLKEMTDHLEFPIFSIQPQPHRGLRRLEFPNPRDPGAPPDYIELRPGLAGLPTIQDQDLLIYCCSKAMSEVNAGRPVPENIQMSTAELLRFANRALGGKQYEAIETAIYRLTELTLVTNIRGEDEVYTELFGIVDRASMVRGTSLRRRSGALLGCSITLSKWMREAIEARKILTLHDDYFRVRRPIDRAVYQLVRKHCGEQKEWTVGVDRLGAKIGSTNQRLSNFRQTIERFAGRWEGENFLDYDVRVVGDRLVAGYAGKGYRRPAAPPLADRHISPETVDEIRRLDPGIDVGRLEAQWRKKADGKGVPIRSADAAFLGYAKKAVEKRRRRQLRETQTPASPGKTAALRERAAVAWWAGIDEDDRRLAREVIGEYIDLPDGRRRLRDENGFALQTFELIVQPIQDDPAACYLPVVVAKILDADMAATGIAGMTLIAAWRLCAPSRYKFIADPLASIALFAEEVKRGRPDALKAVGEARS